MSSMVYVLRVALAVLVCGRGVPLMRNMELSARVSSSGESRGEGDQWNHSMSRASNRSSPGAGKLMRSKRTNSIVVLSEGRIVGSDEEMEPPKGGGGDEGRKEGRKEGGGEGGGEEEAKELDGRRRRRAGESPQKLDSFVDGRRRRRAGESPQQLDSFVVLSYRGADGRRRLMSRRRRRRNSPVHAEWLKPSRCNGSDCSPCGSNTQECWSMLPNDEGLKGWEVTPANSTYTDYRLTLDVNCPSAVAVEILIASTSGSHVEVFQDEVNVGEGEWVDGRKGGGELVEKEKEKEKGKEEEKEEGKEKEKEKEKGEHSSHGRRRKVEEEGEGWGTVRFKPNSHTMGNHEIVIKFTPGTGSASPKAIIKLFEMGVMTDSAVCLKRKQCLSHLNATGALAKKNCEKRSCLDDWDNKKATEECKTWKACMGDIQTSALHDPASELKQVITAGTAKIGEGEGEGGAKCIDGGEGKKASLTERDAPNCLDPSTADPHKFVCSCRDHWLVACPQALSQTDIDSKCLQKLWCNTHPNLCQSWVQAVGVRGACSNSSALEIKESVRKTQPIELLRSRSEPSPSLSFEQDVSDEGHEFERIEANDQTEEDAKAEDVGLGKALDESLTGKEFC